MKFDNGELTTEIVHKVIFDSAEYGNLGLFVGAGFSKAVLNSDGNEIALSWGQLLEAACQKLGVDYQGIGREGYSHPEIATKICEQLAEQEDVTYQDALDKLKWQLAVLTSWYPEATKREIFSAYIEQLQPSWIITTNYDMVIESLMTGRCIPLGPNTPMCAPKDMVPVYHLHGIRSNPDSIIISQEDYIALFRPTEYRQIRLALTIKESTVLLLGYGLGDVNVLTALDWSKNVYRPESANYPNSVIQVVRKDCPKGEPYYDYNGTIIVEVSNLEEFFELHVQLIDGFRLELEEKKKDLEALANELEAPGAELVDQFIDDSDFRSKVLDVLAQFPSQIISGFLTFLNKCLDETWARSSPYGAFSGYSQNLKILLDMMTKLKLEQIPPALLETIAYSLNRVAPFVGDGPGESWAANRTFMARREDLPEDLMQELRSIARQHEYKHLADLLGRV